MIPEKIPNWIGGEECSAKADEWFDKLDPSNGKLLTRAARSRADDVTASVEAALDAFPAWSDTPAVQRGLLLHKIVVEMQNRQEEVARIVAAETGKSYKEALGETGGAIQCGLFYASEGQRLYGRTTTSGTPNKYAMTVRQPIGVAGLVIAANTPIANVAWKIFPALICGNTAILKASEDTPATAWFIGKIAQEVGLPAGVLNIVQGYGEEAGAPLVENPKVGVISFTGSTEVGRYIQRVAGPRFARISLELGGKNSLVVCDDADLDNAAKWVLLSSFSNAGQRCASTSRVIIFDAVYEKFRDLLVEKTKKLRVGTSDEDDFGPVINEGQLNSMTLVVQNALKNGANILTGGNRLVDDSHRSGFYMAPTLIDGVAPHDEISECELFGPVAILYPVKDFDEALALANDSPYGLTASIHTKSIHRALRFADKVQTGVAVVNAGTHGSEPHMPFGGRKQSGNGSREPGTEALNIYSELKDLYINIDPSKV
ncbi:MAG: aldehyde dehydrogenase [Anaerolineales bacterium]|nr:aldehyde dehydrogenase [Anaerolineales bacterium]